jgi:hypothetical protein
MDRAIATFQLDQLEEILSLSDAGSLLLEIHLGALPHRSTVAA